MFLTGSFLVVRLTQMLLSRTSLPTPGEENQAETKLKHHFKEYECYSAINKLTKSDVIKNYWGKATSNVGEAHALF